MAREVLCAIFLFFPPPQGSLSQVRGGSGKLVRGAFGTADGNCGLVVFVGASSDCTSPNDAMLNNLK